MAEVKRRKPVEPLTRADAQLRKMDARQPSEAETNALRALMRGAASASQQKTAMAYVLTELCHVGLDPFTGESPYGTAFRSGSLAVGIAIASIAGAEVMRFPSEEPVRES